MCYASEREKKNINPYKPYEHTLWIGCENECWRILICTGEMAGHAEIVARCGWCGHQPQAFGIFFWCCRVWVCGTYDATMRQTHTHTESDLKCVIFHISMDIIKWKKNWIWPQACLTSTLSLSHSLYHFHISHTPCICGYLFTECLFDGLKPFHFVSPHSMLAQIRAASSPMFSFRHQIRIFIRYFFFLCIYCYTCFATHLH